MIQSDPRYFLLGLMHGHFDSPDDGNIDAVDMDVAGRGYVNMGIGIVVPFEKIMEVVRHPKIKEGQDAIVERLKKERLPTMDSVDIEIKETATDFTQADFDSALRKVSRKIQPGRGV